MVQWYYAQGNQQVGPVDQATIQQLLATGQIRPGDLVWNEGMANWQPASAIPELAVAPANPTPASQVQPAQNQANVPYDPFGQQPAPGPATYAPFPQQQPPPGASFGTVTPLGYGGGSTVGQSYRGLAIGGFVTSMFGLSCFLCVSWVCAPVGLILCIVALNGMKKSGNENGKGLAVAGIICSAIFIVIDVGMFIAGMASKHH